MKKLIKRIIFLVIPLLLILAIWEHGLNKVQNSYSKKRQQLEQNLSNIEVLVFGNSQVLDGVNPALFSIKGYNLANVIQSLYYDKQLTMKYVTRMPKLNYVLISISDFTLWTELYKTSDHWRCYFYQQYWDIKDPDLKWYDLDGSSKIMMYTPFVAFQYALKGFNVDLAKELTPEGWNPVHSDPHENKLVDSLGLDRAMEHESLCNAQYLKDNLGYLDSLIIDLKKLGIKPVLFTPPVPLVYFKYVNEKRIVTTDSLLHSFSKLYNIKYLNYWQDKRFSNTDFGDVFHLNTAGATKFSKILNAEALTDTVHLQ